MKAEASKQPFILQVFSKGRPCLRWIGLTPLEKCKCDNCKWRKIHLIFTLNWKWQRGVSCRSRCDTNILNFIHGQKHKQHFLKFHEFSVTFSTSKMCFTWPKKKTFDECRHRYLKMTKRVLFLWNKAEKYYNFWNPNTMLTPATLTTSAR